MNLNFLKKIECIENPTFAFSICTLVTKGSEYGEMVSSFHHAGFTNSDCEFLYVDNSEINIADAYTGINWFLSHAKGEYIIICHQDILLDKDNRTELNVHLRALDELDPNWAICGNAGAAGPNYIVYHISYPDDVFKSKGSFPLKVSALDENFLILKRSAMLSTSRDLRGFHLYATDLCLNADMKGYSAYAIAFNLTHKSYGNVDISFHQARQQIIRKYNRFFRNRWIQTPSTVFFLSGSMLWLLYANPIFLFVIRMRNGLKKRL
jgi:hypothetical protein